MEGRSLWEVMFLFHLFTSFSSAWSLKQAGIYTLRYHKRRRIAGVPVLEIEYCCYHGMRTKDILEGQKGWGLKTKGRQGQNYVILRFLLCALRGPKPISRTGLECQRPSYKNNKKKCNILGGCVSKGVTGHWKKVRDIKKHKHKYKYNTNFIFLGRWVFRWGSGPWRSEDVDVAEGSGKTNPNQWSANAYSGNCEQKHRNSENTKLRQHKIQAGKHRKIPNSGNKK